jgi:polar amino acid transport system substrate-binding protein
MRLYFDRLINHFLKGVSNMKKLSMYVVLLFVLMMVSACASMPFGSTSSSLQRIAQKGELTVGTSGTQPPFTMKDKEGKVIGLDADIAGRMASAMNVKVNFVTMPFSELLPALEAGKVDMVISSMTITMERNKKVAFVGPYFISGKAFLTKSKTLDSVKDISQINSPKTNIAALKDSTSSAFVKSFLPRAKLIQTIDYKEGVGLVVQDMAHAFVSDYPECLIELLLNADKGLSCISTPFTYEPLGIALPGNDPLFINWADNFLGLMQGSGQINALKDQWFKDTSWLKQIGKETLY